MKFLSALLLSVVAWGQTSPQPVPAGGGVVGSYQQKFNSAYYASRPTQFQAIYYGRPGVVVPQGAQPLTQAQFETLVAQWIANPPVNPTTGKTVPLIEQIDYWQLDPYSIEFNAELYGYTYFPPGQGNVQSTQVITSGDYKGTPPPGTNPVTTNPDDLVPFPPFAPAPVVTTGPVVGDWQFGPYYAVVGGDTSPVGTQVTTPLGKFTKVKVPSAFPIGGAFMVLWRIN